MEENNTSADSEKPGSEEAEDGYNYAVPGAPIVRSSTPRPLPFPLPARTELPLPPTNARADFPAEAPEAPPLPEEPVRNTSASTGQSPFQATHQEADTTEGEPTSRGPVNEFVWLFEYALDMDPVRLNRPDRLDGSAFAYGPAMLKGYRLTFDGLDVRSGRVLASLSEARDQSNAEVWGVLYRVPRRYTRGDAGEMPLLDKVHYADTFVPTEVQVREPYRQREVTCITYVASATTRQQVSQLAPEKCQPEPDYFKRLLQVARRQKLPASYLRTLEELLPPTIPAASPLPTTPPEQNTEPLPAVVIDKKALQRPAPEKTSIDLSVSETPVPQKPPAHRPGPWSSAYPAVAGGWLMAFALYICVLLLATLVLAIFQGLNFWPLVFNDAFTPLGIPWYVLLYGVLGGCVSCLVSLGRPVRKYPPAFVVLTWFMRPFFGAILGSLAYLILNSGAILLSTHPAQHFALCSAAGGLAGFCEGKLFVWRPPLRF